MALNLRPQTSKERKALLTEVFLNNTDLVTKISPFSVMDATVSAISKTIGKAEKDIIVAVSQLFPDTAFGQQLDQVALNFGVAPRLAAIGSSGFVTLIGSVGTTYSASNTIFKAKNGIQFSLISDVTIGSTGFEYGSIQSTSTGSASNVDSLTITNVTPIPSGHSFVINEFATIGGRDTESDVVFRQRIKEGGNILGHSTLAAVEQRMILINPKVLRIHYDGVNQSGQTRISIATQNGQTLTTNELTQLRNGILPFLSLSDSQPYGSSFSGVELLNITYQPIDIQFRVQLQGGVNVDDVRRTIQQGMSSYLNLRTFDPTTQRVEWDNLLDIVKNNSGVKYVPDEFFTPHVDIYVDVHKLPRIRNFRMLDISGNVIQSFTNDFLPIYQQAIIDSSFVASVL